MYKRQFYDKKITTLMGCIDQTLPTRMTLPEQSTFQLGYYFETQNLYQSKKEEQ